MHGPMNVKLLDSFLRSFHFQFFFHANFH